ncbi:hypothetical protein ABER61_02895 [Brevibacillus formosus]|uniref:Uncharacterized protein n=1 Tax=Brevibacillus formosus TaxID=54913 RepID=A0A837KI86_9BACL|nr:hypothetical protein [Brevibacillus formosus]KLH96761.1 hypothetical protein AA984_22390 [Brevibacillus formosus]MED1955187.1 hypothetical protein [Brevibacillus formosus]PSJ94937.1 hypothetical protein C7R91_16770 [Brevibacillus formosus]GED58433.1 hypothetical protein BFO01nite_25650 [Brevibacillus formosus]
MLTLKDWTIEGIADVVLFANDDAVTAIQNDVVIGYIKLTKENNPMIESVSPNYRAIIYPENKKIEVGVKPRR